jgi:hypothetical protein
MVVGWRQPPVDLQEHTWVGKTSSSLLKSTPTSSAGNYGLTSFRFEVNYLPLESEEFGISWEVYTQAL